MHPNLQIERRLSPAPFSPVLFAPPQWQHAVVHRLTGYVFGFAAEQSEAEEIADRLAGIVPRHILEMADPPHGLANAMRVTNGGILRRVNALFLEYRNSLQAVAS